MAKYGKDDEHGPRDAEYVPVDHHTTSCDIYFKGERIPTIESYSYQQAYKSFWCATHNQWTYNFPIKVEWTYEK